MSFSYSGDPSKSGVDYIRFNIGDRTEPAILSDEEIGWILLEAPDNKTKQLALAFRQCANIYATKPTRRKLGPQEETTESRLAYFEKQASYYEKLQSFGVPPLPEYSTDKLFDKNMMVNNE